MSVSQANERFRVVNARDLKPGDVIIACRYIKSGMRPWARWDPHTVAAPVFWRPHQTLDPDFEFKVRIVDEPGPEWAGEVCP